MNLKLFIKVDSDICLLRRIARDMNERGRSLESISEQYKATVKPMREKYIDRYIDKADVVVMRGGMNEQALKTTISYLKSCVKEQRLAESEKTKATETIPNKSEQLRMNNHNERIIPVIVKGGKGFE